MFHLLNTFKNDKLFYFRKKKTRFWYRGSDIHHIRNGQIFHRLNQEKFAYSEYNASRATFWPGYPNFRVMNSLVLCCPHELYHNCSYTVEHKEIYKIKSMCHSLVKSRLLIIMETYCWNYNFSHSQNTLLRIIKLLKRTNLKDVEFFGKTVDNYGILIVIYDFININVDNK